MRNSASCTEHNARLRDSAPEWTVADLIAVLVRRRAWLLGFIGVFLALALLYCASATPRYRATAEIEVQEKAQGAFGLENTTSDKPSAEVNDSFDANLNLQTEIAILQSDALALDVIGRTALERTPDYFAPRVTSFAWINRPITALFFWRKPLEPLSTPLADAPNRRYVALRTFSHLRKVSTVPGTRLIAISYSDRDPQRSAQVVSALLQALSDYGFQSRSSAAAQSAVWLTAQLGDLRKQTEALDDRAATLDRQAGALADDDSHNVVLARLDELNTALSTAESNRIVREAIWRAVQSGDPEVISGLGGNPAASSNTQNSFALLQSLRSQEAAAKAQLAEASNRYGENWPAVAEQRARLATTEESIRDEVRRLGERAHNDYEVSVRAEDSARGAFNSQKELAASLTGSAVALRLARQEAGESRNLYATLLGRLQQAGVLEGLHSGNFLVVTPALVPPTNHPSSPNLPLIFAAALAAGTCLGSTSAVIREVTDDSIHSADDLEAAVEVPVFVTLPRTESGESWLRRLLPARTSPLDLIEVAAGSDFAVAERELPFTEALHRLRISLLLSHSGKAPGVILLMGLRPQRSINRTRDCEAASTNSRDGYQENKAPSIALSFAVILAQHGSPTLYIDADLRSAPAGGMIPVQSGLSDMLVGEQSAVFKPQGGSPALLSVIASGPRPPCPSELIASRRMSTLLTQWREEFAFVVIDGPAAVYADALVLAQQADAVLVSVPAGKTKKSEVLPIFHSLSRQVPDHAVLGLVLDGDPHAHA